MHEVIVQAFVERIEAGLMELEQVPEVYKEEVRLQTAREVNRFIII